jgi:hypothetical protein
LIAGPEGNKVLIMRNLEQCLEEVFLPMSLSHVPSLQTVRCREIVVSDLEGVIGLLTEGFQHVRDRAYWTNAIQALSEYASPPGYPKYGYLLESNGLPVGVLLLVFYAASVGGTTRVRCNTSSWYVRSAFSSYAPILARKATRHPDVTYLNITPSPHTWPMLEAQGYRRFANGVFVSVPALSRSSSDLTIHLTSRGVPRDSIPQLPETDLLLAHQAYGCLSLVGVSGDQQYPFVFGLRRKHGVPLAHLVYCRDQQDFVRYAGPLGRFLAKRGFPLVVLDCNGPVCGLVGWYVADKPKYFKGSDSPPLGDLAYTERVMFGY